MSGRLIGMAVAIGLIALFVGLFVHPMVTAHDNDITQSVSASDEIETISDPLEVSSDVDAGNETANITLYDRSSQNTAETSLTESETDTVTISGEDINVTLDSTETDTARLTVSYPAMFGWSDPAVLFAENVGLIITIAAFVSIMGLLLVVRA